MAWEGQRVTDSFFTYRVGKKWYGIYGSRNHIPPTPWLVGLSEAPSLAVPYRWIKDHSSLLIERNFIENPMAEPVPGVGACCPLGKTWMGLGVPNRYGCILKDYG